MAECRVLVRVQVCDWSSLFGEAPHHLQRQGEDDSGVLLGGDGVERLQVAQLQSGGRLGDHQRSLLQGSGGIHLSLGSDHLQ